VILYLNNTRVDNVDRKGGVYVAMENLGANVDIGRYSTAGIYTTGSIADVKIYDRALTPSEITVLYNNENVPGAVLDMPLTQETQFKDISGNSNHGTNSGARIDGYCGSFVSESADYVDVGENIEFNNSPFMISLWFRTTTTVSNQKLIERTDTNY